MQYKINQTKLDRLVPQLSMKAQARPGRRKSSAKREAILCAAADLFLAHGLQRTSIDAVAERAGVSKQTVYSHFGSKDELFRAVIGAKVGAYGLEDLGMSVDQDPATALNQLGLRLVELIHDPEVVGMKRVVIAEAASQPKLARLFFESGPGALVAAVRNLLLRAEVARQLAIDDAEHATRMFAGMIMAPYQLPLLFGTAPAYDSMAVEKHVERVVEQFLSLYTRSESPAGHHAP